MKTPVFHLKFLVGNVWPQVAGLKKMINLQLTVTQDIDLQKLFPSLHALKDLGPLSPPVRVSIRILKVYILLDAPKTNCLENGKKKIKIKINKCFPFLPLQKRRVHVTGLLEFLTQQSFTRHPRRCLLKVLSFSMNAKQDTTQKTEKHKSPSPAGLGGGWRRSHAVESVSA